MFNHPYCNNAVTVQVPARRCNYFSVGHVPVLKFMVIGLWVPIWKYQQVLIQN